MKYKYEIIRSSRRSVAVEVGRDGSITVRAPYRYPQREIDSFLESRGEWIDKSLERQR